MTIFLTTHYLEKARRPADRVALLVDGQIVACDTVAGLKGRAADRDAMVEIRYRNSLATEHVRLHGDDSTPGLRAALEQAEASGREVVSIDTVRHELHEAGYRKEEGTTMFGLLLPVFLFLFFSFSIKRDIGVEVGLARLLALTTFFTASSAGPMIIPLDRRIGDYDRLLVAPMSLDTLLLGKTLVGAFFASVVSLAPLLIGLLALGVTVADAVLLLIGVPLDSLAFSAFGLAFASIPTRSVGNIMMPSTLLRWSLMFISGIFVPLEEMAGWARVLAYFSPLTYVQDLMNHAVLGRGFLNPWLDLALLPILLVIFLIPAARLHHRAKVRGVGSFTPWDIEGGYLIKMSGVWLVSRPSRSERGKEISHSSPNLRRYENNSCRAECDFCHRQTVTILLY
ncbi:MAG TPA: hypothetical protein ENN19_10685 [Chloroflexi bacterium]|nr:hypothetical protein [Chloroflexota bacterium]